MIDRKPSGTGEVDASWLAHVVSLNEGDLFEFEGKTYRRTSNAVRDVVMLVAKTQGFDRGLLCLRGIFVLNEDVSADFDWKDVRADYERFCAEEGVPVPSSS